MRHERSPLPGLSVDNAWESEQGDIDNDNREDYGDGAGVVEYGNEDTHDDIVDEGDEEEELTPREALDHMMFNWYAAHIESRRNRRRAMFDMLRDRVGIELVGEEVMPSLYQDHEEEDEDQIFSRLKLAVGKILSCAAPLSTLDVIKHKKDSSEITESVLQAASIAIRQTLSALRKSKRDQSDLVKRCSALYSECLRLIGASSHPASRTVSLVLSRIKAEEWLYK